MKVVIPKRELEQKLAYIKLIIIFNVYIIIENNIDPLNSIKKLFRF